jgi:pimeloyl-ACP methyl ester carboxylesterase
MPAISLADRIGGDPDICISSPNAITRSVWECAHRERAFAPTWIQLQKQLAALSTQAHWSIVKGSSHAIYADNPGAVVDAIRRVWESSQRESRDQISHGP